MILVSQDKMTPLKAGLVVAKNLNAKLTVLEGFGHMLPIEAPKQVLAALREFILSITEK
jgi:pimeloyl-ACP methyl ester carboxylesterase